MPITLTEPSVSSIVRSVRLIVGECTVTYTGRLSAHLPKALRLIMVKADGSVLIHADGGSYKPLNWMTPPCTLIEQAVIAISAGDAGLEPAPEPVSEPASEPGVTKHWTVQNKAGDKLDIRFYDIQFDQEFELGKDPGLTKDGVEAHLQELLAAQIDLLGDGHSLVRREFPTAIGPVDILARSNIGHVAVEIKRRGEIAGVEQLTRYLELLNRDPRLAPVRGIFAAQEIKPQAKVLAADRGIECLILDYETLRGDDSELRLF